MDEARCKRRDPEWSLGEVGARSPTGPRSVARLFPFPRWDVVSCGDRVCMGWEWWLSLLSGHPSYYIWSESGIDIHADSLDLATRSVWVNALMWAVNRRLREISMPWIAGYFSDSRVEPSHVMCSLVYSCVLEWQPTIGHYMAFTLLNIHRITFF